MTTTDELSRDARAATTGPGSRLTAPNRSIQVDGDSLIYRRFGNERTEAPPLVCLQHFRGNLDSWDPALVDRLAEDRGVILLDNRGVGGSTGVVPDNVTDMARDALAFIDALGLEEVDILGFLLGGYVAQELAQSGQSALRNGPSRPFSDIRRKDEERFPIETGKSLVLAKDGWQQAV